jgi:hypothetical protein
MSSKKGVGKTSVDELLYEVKERLLFPHGVLTLLKNKNLFGLDLQIRGHVLNSS